MTPRVAHLLLLLGGAVALASCSPEYGEAPFACAQSAVCPEGYHCVDKVCRREGSSSRPPDAHLDKSGWVRRDLGPAPDRHLGAEPSRTDLPRIDLAKLVDQAVPVGWTCQQIYTCSMACTNAACAQACYNQGSADAKAKIDALDKCFYQYCDPVCTDQADCNACELYYCPAQRAACGV